MKTIQLTSKTLQRFCRTCLVQLDASSRAAKYNFRNMKMLSTSLDESSETVRTDEEKEEQTEFRYPKFLCQQCHEKMQSFHDFRAMSLRSMHKCRELFATVISKEQQQNEAVPKMEMFDHVVSSEMEQQLVAQEHEQVLNDIYGNRDWLEFGDYDSKSPIRQQQKQQTLAKQKQRKSKRINMDPFSETDESSDVKNLVLSSLSENEVFLNESFSSNYKQENSVDKCLETDNEMESILQETKFEFQGSAALKPQRDTLEDNQAEELQQVIKDSSAHESDEDFNADFDNESDESDEFHYLPQSKTKIKRMTTNSNSSLTSPPADSTIAAAAVTKSTPAKRPGGGLNKLQCEYCPHRCINEVTLAAHIRTHQGLKPYQCGECTRSFNKAYYLRQHIREDHTKDGRQTEIVCAYEGCGKSFRRAETYKTHYRIKHTSDPNTTSVHKQTFVCEVCGRTFKNITTLKEHRYKHRPAEEYPFQCVECGKRYTSPRVYKEHLMRHAGIKNYICPHCGMRKTTRNELRTHINYHTKERQWPCPHCPSVFNNSANLGMHDRVVHKGIRRFACRYCDLSFGKPDTLKHHEMRHTGERPHKCQLCDKAFIQIVALRAHMKTHNKSGGGCDPVDGCDNDKQTEKVETLVQHDQRREMTNACLQLVKDLTDLHKA